MDALRMKQYAIIVGIAVIFSALVISTADAFYPAPQYEDFCRGNQGIPTKVVPDDKTCNWQAPDAQAAACYDNKQEPTFTYNETGCRVFKECSNCSVDREAAFKHHGRMTFLIIALIGAIAIVLGTLYKIDFIGTGFMVGGIFLVFFATVSNFQYLDKFVRVGVLLFDLLVVLWVAKKKVAIHQAHQKH